MDEGEIISKESLIKVGKVFCDLLMIFGPSMGYLAQGIKFKQTHSSQGFSKYMCFVLLLSNILRIFFWIGKQFTIVLLFQSCATIISQFFLIHMVLKYNFTNSTPTPSNIKTQDKKKPKPKVKTIIIKKFFSKLYFKLTLCKRKFWKWEKESEYYIFILIFSLCIFILCLIVGFNNMKFMNVIGIISALSESVIPLPQIKENYAIKDSKNVSLLMVLTWLVGDTFRALYCIASNSPIQFIICGFLQVILEIILTIQIVYYGHICDNLEEEINKENETKRLKKKSEKIMHLMNGEDSTQNDDNSLNGLNINIVKKDESENKINTNEAIEEN